MNVGALFSSAIRSIPAGMTLVLFLGLPPSTPAAENDPRAYITNFDSATVSVIDTASNSVVTTVPVGGAPIGVAAHGATSRVYVTNFADSTVSVIDTDTDVVIATIPVGSGPNGIAVNAQGTRVYVVNQASDSLSIVDCTSNRITNTIEFATGALPVGVAVHPDDSRVFVSHAGEPDAIVIIDASRERVTGVISLAPGSNAKGIAPSPDGSRLYAALAGRDSVAVVDTGTTSVITTVPVGGGPQTVVVHPTGNPMYVTNFISGTLSVVDTVVFSILAIPNLGNPFGVDLTPDGSRVYVADNSSTGHAVFVIEPAGNTVVDMITVGSRPVAFGRFIGGFTSPPVANQCLGLRNRGVCVVCCRETTGCPPDRDTCDAGEFCATLCRAVFPPGQAVPSETPP